jgi:N-acetylglucosaminyldiphosphoundecaprenol N-acetyl-beta-D-mannosaminyltransferase
MPITPDLPIFPRYRVLGMWLNALDLQDLISILEDAVRYSRRIVLANQNLHGVYIWTQDEKVRRFFRSVEYIHIDGTSLIFIGRLRGFPFRAQQRIGYMDLFPSLIPIFIREGWRVFYLGGREQVLEAGLERLRAEYPGLQIDGHHGYFDKRQGCDDNQQIVNRINAFRPQILFVGMGMPIQEHWILDNRASLETNVILHCGALMDYIAGALRTPPRWLGPIGLEWAFRLLCEPQRLWKRYLVEPLEILRFGLSRQRQSKLGETALKRWTEGE